MAVRLPYEEEQDLLKKINDVVWKMDLDLNLTYVSPACERIIGYSREERMAQSIKSQMTPASFRKAIKLFSDELARENEPGVAPDRSIVVDLEYYHKDGRALWFENVISWDRTDDGKIIGIQGVSREITDRLLAYQALRESEEKFRLAFYTSPDSINLNRLEDGMYLDINQGFTEILGYTRDEVLGKTSLQLNIWKHPEDRNRLVQGLKAGGYVENLEAEFVGKNGRIRYGLMSARILSLGNETVILSITRDITERKYAENEIRQNAENLRAIFDASPSAVALVDNEVRVEMMNRKGATLVGKDRKNLSGELCGDVLNCLNSFHGSGCGKNPECPDCPLRTRVLSTFETGEPHIEEEGQMTFLLNGKETVMDILVSTSLLEIDGDGKVILSMTDISKQKQIEKSLTQSEQRFQLAMDAAKDGIYDWDLETRDIYYSPGWKRMLGYEPDEIPNHFSVWEKLTLPEDVESSWKMMRELIEGKRDRFEKEFKMRHKKGHWVDILSRANLYRNKDEKSARVVGTHVDISDLKKAIAAKNKSDERFRGIVESTADWIWEVDAQGRYTYCSESVKDILGYLPQEITGKTLFDFMDPGIVHCHREAFRRLIEDKGEIRDFENWNIHKDGRKICLLTNGVPILGDSGELTGFRGVDRDITERKQNEERLMESEAVHKELFDNSPIPLFIEDHSETVALFGKLKKAHPAEDMKSYLTANPDMAMLLASTVKIVKGNRAAAQMCKVGSPEELDKTLASALKQDDILPFINQILDFTNGRDGYQGEARRLDHEGNVMDVLLRKAVINREKNGFSKIIVSVTDVTSLHRFHREKELMEARLQQAQKMESIGSLAGGIAHDFNNILFPIVGLAEMLMEDLPVQSPERVNAREILQAGKRGADLVKQILAFSRRQEHKMIHTRVQQVLKEVVKLVRSTIPANIKIHQDLQHDCGLILADATQIHQIGMNLITNAYHAVEDISGEITVKVKEVILDTAATVDLSISAGKYALLSVSDNGVGIPIENLNKIFDPYFTTKEMGKGTGLGLAVVYGIVKEHKGDIRVYSEVGKGTRVEVYLPLMAVPVFEYHTEDVLSGRGTERVLLVDDEPPIVSLEKQVLERLGYTVGTRTDSTEAWEAFKSNPDGYDLVITDMSMPSMTGEQLAQNIFNVRPDIPIIICTGFSDRINERKAKEMGIKGFLMKPVIKSDLLREVRRVLDEAQNRIQN